MGCSSQVMAPQRLSYSFPAQTSIFLKKRQKKESPFGLSLANNLFLSSDKQSIILFVGSQKVCCLYSKLFPNSNNSLSKPFTTNDLIPIPKGTFIFNPDLSSKRRSLVVIFSMMGVSHFLQYKGEGKSLTGLGLLFLKLGLLF